MSIVTTKKIKYRSDPESFILDVFGDSLWSKQRDLLGLIRDGAKRIAVKAAHAVSKSFTCGRLALWNTACFSKTLTITTAPTHRQVDAVLWKEIRSGWASSKYQLSAKPPLPGSPEWTIRPDQRALGFSSDKPERFQGLHEGEGRVLMVGDEACGIMSSIWPAMFALVTGSDDILILIGNPDFRNPDFMRCFSDPSFQTLTISAYDSPNFTGENVPDKLKKALVSRQWADDLIRAYGEDSPIVRSKLYAEFPEENADTLIPMSFIEAAEERAPNTVGDRLAGMDVARYGSDRTVIWHITGNKADLVLEIGKESLMVACGHAVNTIKEGYDLALDDTGLGGGVTDRLREINLYPAAVNFGMKALESERFFNSRAEMFWSLRNWLKDTGSIQKDTALRQELNDIRYNVRSDGRIQVEAKDEIRKRAGKSPDKADALALAVSGHRYGARVGRIESDTDVEFVSCESSREMF